MKINPLKKKKDKSTSWYLKKADGLFSKFIRDRDKHTCYTCGKKMPPNLSQNGHYISRSCTALRFHEANSHCQCVACNIFKKGNYPVYSLKLLKEYGDNILYELDEIAKEIKRNIKHYGKDYYKKIIELYE